MQRTFRAALSRVTARAVGSRYAKPIARIVLATAGLILLALIGRSAVAGAIGRSAVVAPASSIAAASAEPSPQGSAPAPNPTNPPAPVAPATNAQPPSLARASPDEPVVLNAAAEPDLRRLPGIGAKRAEAILALRARLGRFHAVEDLLKVKGIGRATLKRLRPLLRVDPSPTPDAGLPQPAKAPQ